MSEWRKRTDENGDRNYQYFREMFPELDDQIIEKFKLGFGATILYENMSQEELGKLIYNAIAIGFVSGRQQSDAASAVWNEAVEACIAKLKGPLTIAAPRDVIIGIEDMNELYIEALRDLKRNDKTEEA